MFPAISIHTARGLADPGHHRLVPSGAPHAFDLMQSGRAPDPAVFLHDAADGLHLRINGSLQALLGEGNAWIALEKRISDADFLPVPRISRREVPAEANGFTERTNTDLVVSFGSMVLNLDLKKQPPGKAPAHSSFKTDMLWALRESPTRAQDVNHLEEVLRVVERFAEHQRYALGIAVEKRPDLQSTIRHIARTVIVDASTDALHNNPVFEHLLDPEELIQRAEEWKTTRAHAALMEQTRAFYERPDAVEGNSERSAYDQKLELARGRIVFRNLEELLRYAPIGEVYIRQLRGSSYMFNGIRVVLQPKNETRVTYPESEVQHMYYREPESGRNPIRVVVGKHGYQVGDEPFRPFPEDIPPSVREQNRISVRKRIEEARLRTAG